LRVRESEDVPAQAMHGRFGGQTGTGAGLVERREERLLGEQVPVAAISGEVLELLADLEHPEVFVPLEVLQRQDVPAQKAPHGSLLVPVNSTATCWLSAIPASSRPASPAVPVASASVPVDRPTLLARARVSSSTTTGRPPVSSIPATTSYQSYVSS